MNGASTKRKTTAVLCGFALLCALALAGVRVSAQQAAGDSSSQSPSPTKQSQQATPPSHKSTAQDNPFPSDVSRQAAQQPQGSQPSQPSPDAPDGSQPAAPDASPPAQKTGDAAKENPFPEDVSKGAAAAAANDSNAGSSTSSGGGYSSSSSGAAPTTDPDADLPRDTGRRKLRKPSDNDIESGSLAGQGRAVEDAKVGSFYLNDGNYRGAYARFAEASRLDPGNMDAVYGLAVAAEGLHHTDEALSNYRVYLAVAPDGSHAKSAAKAIRVLTSKAGAK